MADSEAKRRDALVEMIQTEVKRLRERVHLLEAETMEINKRLDEFAASLDGQITP